MASRPDDSTQQTGGAGRAIGLALAALFLLGGFVAWSSLRPDAAAPVEPQLEEVAGKIFGTTYSVKLVDPLGKVDVGALGEATDARLAEIDAAMSTYKESSELSRFNRAAVDAPVKAGPGLILVLEKARLVHDQSDGAFDVTVGPLVNAWGFGPDKRPVAPPDVDELRALVGMEKVSWGGGQLRKAEEGVYVDLSAIAKGWAVDEIARLLEANGVERYMVEIGGEIRARGTNQDGEVWRIGIEKPEPGGERSVYEALPLEDRGMATSGDYRNYYELDGERLSHTIDPRTGRPITHKLASVTVLHEECALADAYATALNVLGPERGYALAVDLKLPALFIVRVGDRFEERATPAFQALREDSP